MTLYQQYRLDSAPCSLVLTVSLVESVLYLDEVVGRLPIVVAAVVILLAVLVVVLVVFEVRTDSPSFTKQTSTVK